MIVAWNTETVSNARCLLPDGTVVVTQANGQVCILKLHYGNLHQGPSVRPDLAPLKQDSFQSESWLIKWREPRGARMKRKRFSEEQIIGILKQAEGGLPLPELIRQHGICEGIYYRWKSKYGGMELGEAKRLKQLEDENRRLKRLVADQALDIQILKEVASGKY